MDKKIYPKLRIQFFSDEKIFGPGVVQLLKSVDELHSLRKATISINMAYSKAWAILKVAEENLGFKLLETKTGGKNGGGAVLTDKARILIKDYDQFYDEINDHAIKLFAEKFDYLM